MTVIVIQDEKHVGEARRKGFDLTPFSTNYWRPGMVVTTDYCVRPATPEMADALGYSPRKGPTGYQYRAVIPGGAVVGMTASKEPLWGTDQITDGTVLWVPEPISSDSLFRTIVNGINDIEWIAPPEMTVSNEEFVVAGGVIHVAAIFGGGIEGSTHRTLLRVNYSDNSIEEYAIDWTIVDDQID